jgi:hypothetical protein
MRALINSTLIRRFADMHEQYGDVVRVGPDELSFATGDAWRDIYEYRPGHKETTKDPTWYIGKLKMKTTIRNEEKNMCTNGGFCSPGWRASKCCHHK